MEFIKKNLGIILGAIAVLSMAGGVVYAASNGSLITITTWTGNMLNPESAAPVEQSIGSASLPITPQAAAIPELCYIDPTSAQRVCSGVLYSAMPATGVNTSTVFLQNVSSHPILIDLAETFIQFSGTVSSSVDISCATSTKTGIPLFTTAFPSNAFIQAFRLVTSTVGASDQGLALPTTTRKQAYLANNEAVVCGWAASVGNSNGCTGSFCESVSSSNRGYNAGVYIPYTYTQVF